MKAFFTSALIIASLSLNAAAYDQDQTVAELMEFTTGLITGLEYNTRGKKRCLNDVDKLQPVIVDIAALIPEFKENGFNKNKFS